MKTMNSLTRSASGAIALAAGAALLASTVPSLLGAQNVDARWQPWIGCWSATSGNDRADISLSGHDTQRFVCVSPAATQNPAEVVITSIADGKVLSRETIDANGARVTKTVDDCPGWESAQWSADGQRLLLKSEFVCSGKVDAKGVGCALDVFPGRVARCSGL